MVGENAVNLLLSVRGIILFTKGVLKGHGEVESNTGELDGESRTAYYVKIGELTEGVLHFEQACEFCMQSVYARATC